MSNSPASNDEPLGGISDEQLPEDLRPTEDNPLAKPLTDEDDPKSPEELDVLGGKTPEQLPEQPEEQTDDAQESDGDQAHSEG